MKYLTLKQAQNQALFFDRYVNPPKFEKWLKQALICVTWVFKILDMVAFASWFE